jgi:DNA-binding beta-propeller fold protein YncE
LRAVVRHAAAINGAPLGGFGRRSGCSTIYLCGGAGVSNDEQFGGVGILVSDADNAHKFVRRIGIWETYRREAIEPIKGIAAHAATGRLYVSTIRRLAAFDLATDKIVWQKGYDADCCDRMAVSTDGKTPYVPAFNLPKWYVVDAGTGNVITTIVTEGEAHNTIYSPHTGRIYLASLRTPTLAIVDSRTNQVIKRVGPFSNQTRPFSRSTAERPWSMSTSTTS